MHSNKEVAIRVHLYQRKMSEGEGKKEMYEPIFARSFSRKEQRNFGYCALFVGFLIALSICTVFKPHFHALSTLNSRYPVSSTNEVLMASGVSISQPVSLVWPANIPQLAVTKNILNTVDNVAADTINSPRIEMEENTSISKPINEDSSASFSEPSDAETKKEQTHVTSAKIEQKENQALCKLSEPMSDYCELSGDIRVQGSSSTIFIVSSQKSITTENHTWTIKPYARKASKPAMERVKNWTINLAGGDENVPTCSVNHSTPAILFSLKGFLGNHFHDFTDLLIPLYSTSLQFNQEVKFLATDYQSWWIAKFYQVLGKLSKHKIVDIDKENDTIHCFPRMIIGLICNKEFGIDSARSPDGLSMKNFRQFLRSTYLLERSRAIKLRKGADNRKPKPRLMIISRKRSRLLLNEDDVIKMARSLGYEVVVAEANLSTNLSKFSQIVNSCDVLMGVHGAGLTNMVFLPDQAILLQVVPYGIDGIAKHDFGEPAGDMNIKYMEYKIIPKESSLIQQYPLDHGVFRNPLSLHKQGWDVISSTYLDKQDVRLDVHRFKAVLLKAMKLLSY